MKATLAAAVLAAFSAAQAQDKPAAAPPPSWQQGKPPASESTLHPFAIEMTGKASKDLPINKLKVPGGFKVEVWAEGMPGARSLAQGDKGTVFVGTRQLKEVYAVVDRGGKREAKVLLKGLESPDGKLYYNVGAPGNIVMPGYFQATVSRVDPNTGVIETVAQGVRNSVGMDFHPKTKELWFTNHARDWLGDDSPNDTLHRVSRKGMNFGYPFCHQGDTPDPQFGKNRSCKDFDPPALKLGAHIAP